MEPGDRKRLQCNHKYLVENLDRDEILDALYSFGVINSEEKEDIEIERTSRKAARIILRILPKKGPTAYKHFRQALLESETLTFIVQHLDETDISKVEIEDTTFQQEDAMAQFQHQMFLQTELIMQFKREKDELEKRVQQSEAVTEELKSKYKDFENIVEQQGLTSREARSYLKEYLTNSKDVPDFSFQSLSSPMPSPSKMSVSPSQSFTFSLSDIHDNSAVLCEAIARDIGKDVVRYMVQNTIKVSKIKSPSSKYSASMRKYSDILLEEYEHVFTSFIVKLQVDGVIGYDSFVTVADEIFVGNNNWGRVVALYAFAGFVARSAAENENENMAMFMGDFLGFYIVKKLGPWIEEQGGWDTYLKRFPVDQEEHDWRKWLFAAVGLAGASALVGIVAAKS